MISFKTCIRCLLLCGLASAILPANAQDTTFEKLPSDYDCVVEPRSKVNLGSADEGIISEILVERDDVVHKGDIVARLDSDVQALTVELARLKAERDMEIRSGKARLKFRESAVKRAETLSEKRIVSVKSLEEAETERLLADLGVKAAEMDHRMAQVELKHAQTMLERRNIRSPVDGLIVSVTMAVGEFAHKQAEIMTIAQVDPLNVEVFVPIRYYGSIKKGMMGEVVLEEPVGGKYLAKVRIVDRLFDTASSTFGVRLNLPNPKISIPAGIRCRIRFLSE